MDYAKSITFTFCFVSHSYDNCNFENVIIFIPYLWTCREK